MPLNKYAAWGAEPTPARPAGLGAISRKTVRPFLDARGKTVSSVGFGYHVVEEGLKVTYYVTLSPEELGTLAGMQLGADRSGAASATFHAALAKAFEKQRKSRS